MNILCLTFGLLFAVVLVLLLFFLFLVFFEDKFNTNFARRNRIKHPYKYLYKKLIKGKKSVNYIINSYLYDIISDTSCSSIITDTNSNILAEERKNEVLRTFRYMLNLAQTEVLSEAQVEDILYFVFNNLIINEDEAEALRPHWYEKENIRYKDFVLLEATEKRNPPKAKGEAYEWEYTLLFKHTETEKEIAIPFTNTYDIAKLVNEMVKTTKGETNG